MQRGTLFFRGDKRQQHERELQVVPDHRVQYLPGVSVWVFNQFGLGDRCTVCCRAEFLCREYKNTTAASCVTVISIFIRNGPRFNPSSIYIFLQPFFFFNVPCVQNQNQSVHLLVPDKVCTGKGGRGLISKSFFFFFSCAININRYVHSN